MEKQLLVGGNYFILGGKKIIIDIKLERFVVKRTWRMIRRNMNRSYRA